MRRVWALCWMIAVLASFAAAQTSARMIVSWDLIEDAAKYRIQTSVGTLPFVTALECLTPPCTITDIDELTRYQVRVAGLDLNGVEGNYSEPVSFYFPDVQPLAPGALTVSSVANEPGKIGKKLSWSPVTKYRTGSLIANPNIYFPPMVVPLIEYRVYQAETGPDVLISTTSANSLIVQLTRRKSFHFYVTCIVGGVESYSTPSLRINTN